MDIRHQDSRSSTLQQRHNPALRKRQAGLMNAECMMYWMSKRQPRGIAASSQQHHIPMVTYQ